MWPRVVEMMLACWLVASPFIFGLPDAPVGPWVACFVGGTLIFTLSSLSLWSRTRRANLLLIPVSIGIFLYGRFAPPSHPPAPIYQDLVTVGLLVLMFAIIPTEALEPPEPWRRFYARRRARDRHIIDKLRDTGGNGHFEEPLH